MDGKLEGKSSLLKGGFLPKLAYNSRCFFQRTVLEHYGCTIAVRENSAHFDVKPSDTESYKCFTM